MPSEDLKKKFMTSRDFYTAKRWEGKPWSYKIKFGWANYPEIMLACVFFAFIGPAMCYWDLYSFEGSKRQAITKYKNYYNVVRDDHPELEEIIKEKERGREYFPN